MANPIVEASLHVMQSLARSLLPSSPTRSHYNFGYGDLVRVFKTIVAYNPAPKVETIPKSLLLKYVG